MNRDSAIGRLCDALTEEYLPEIMQLYTEEQIASLMRPHTELLVDRLGWVRLAPDVAEKLATRPQLASWSRLRTIFPGALRQ